ncbi:hypothetical protein FOCC_FOCC014650 [Frankliniella occidentalis]|uniref:Uncharacterized protein LOC113210877 n=1 Tax=Frankliniella occidentalis TaxID=133901 RepID=A0A6J1SVC8_FRAOC|nr:uncharacterized protein LOC113210877 [Frankliniella occidentalis]KAE8739849.1 hypothetical protein FOCC_FOCC014650 [Frankliniella occidentalis]
MPQKRSLSKCSNSFKNVNYLPRSRKDRNLIVKRIAGNGQGRLSRLLESKCKEQEHNKESGLVLSDPTLLKPAVSSPSPRRVINTCRGLNKISVPPPLKLRKVNKKTVLEKRGEILQRVETESQEENSELKMQKEILEAELTALDQFLYWQESEIFDLECAVAEEDL